MYIEWLNPFPGNYHPRLCAIQMLLSAQPPLHRWSTGTCRQGCKNSGPGHGQTTLQNQPTPGNL